MSTTPSKVRISSASNKVKNVGLLESKVHSTSRKELLLPMEINWRESHKFLSVNRAQKN